jgi:hypothetical protein
VLPRRVVVVTAAALALVGCGSSEPVDAGAAPNMELGYVNSGRELGAVGMTDEQILVAGRFVFSKYGNMAKPDVPYSQRFAAYGDLLDQNLVPERPGDKVLGAILDSFLCLQG